MPTPVSVAGSSVPEITHIIFVPEYPTQSCDTSFITVKLFARFAIGLFTELAS
jgi:hypothetical protein